VFRLCLAPASMLAAQPEGRWPPVPVHATRRLPRSATVPADPRRAPLESIASWLRLLPKEGPRPQSQPPRRAARTQVDPPEGNPRIGPDHPKVIGFRCRPRRIPEGTLRNPAHDPEGGAVVRAPALHSSAVARVPLESPLAADSRRPKAWSSARHSSLASRRMLRRTRPSNPRRNHGGRANRSATRRWSADGSWLRRLPASWSAGLGPDRHRLRENSTV
jgi:hypothetical protein